MLLTGYEILPVGFWFQMVEAGVDSLVVAIYMFYHHCTAYVVTINSGLVGSSSLSLSSFFLS